MPADSLYRNICLSLLSGMVHEAKSDKKISDAKRNCRVIRDAYNCGDDVLLHKFARYSLNLAKGFGLGWDHTMIFDGFAIAEHGVDTVGVGGVEQICQGVVIGDKGRVMRVDEQQVGQSTYRYCAGGDSECFKSVGRHDFE